MSVKAIWVAIQTGLAGVGAAIAAFLGGLDGPSTHFWPSSSPTM